jgi:hypothetical protein
MPYSIDLRSIQAPLKDSYRSDPATALVTTSARSVPSDLADPRHCAVAPVEHSQVVIRGIELEAVEVQVDIDWDFRGTTGVDREVPVGATGIRMQTRVKLKEGIDSERARRMLGSAERYCSTLQTLRYGVNVTTDFAIANT